MKSTILPIPRMPRSPQIPGGTAKTASEALADAHRTGNALAASLGKVLEAIPGGPMRPSALAQRLNVSRVLVSRTLGALASKDPLDALQRLPGPETLRVIVTAAQGAGVPAIRTAAANRDIESFAKLIRDSFGTRGALNAAICAGVYCAK